jgi:hypothetical protein
MKPAESGQAPVRLITRSASEGRVMGDEEVVIEYKGYLLIERAYPGSATNRIRRPDGTWRYSEPTVVGRGWSGWVVARRSPGGAVLELEALSSCEEARQWVDSQGEHPE